MESRLPGFDGAGGWLNSAAADAGRPARQRRAGRLLDVHLHQLAAHARLRPRLGREVPRPRAGGGRRAHAGVPLRARRGQRPPGRGRAWTSAIRSRSTATTRSGAPSTTTTGRRCTSPTPRGGSATTTSARAAYDESERAIQHLLREAGRDGIGDDLVSIVPDGVEAQADWDHLESPETYLGFQQGSNFVAPDVQRRRLPRRTPVPDALPLNGWALAGNGRSRSVRRVEPARRTDRVPVPRARRQPRPALARRGAVPFRVLIDGGRPGRPTASTSTSSGNGTLVEPRLYQLIREPGAIADHTFEIASRPRGRGLRVHVRIDAANIERAIPFGRQEPASNRSILAPPDCSPPQNERRRRGSPDADQAAPAGSRA